MLRRSKLPDGFQGTVLKTGFKDRDREGCGVCDQLVDMLLIGWQRGYQESASSALWFLRPGVHVLVLMGSM